MEVKYGIMIISYEPDNFPPAKDLVTRTGRRAGIFLRNVGRGTLLVIHAFAGIPKSFHYGRPDISRAMIQFGIKSFGVTSTVALFTGMILALQAGLILRSYGQEMRVGYLVSQTMFREMGPFMTALILAASVGSAMAAQLGTMKVSQEIAALDVMSINPIHFLVTPRLIAMMIMTPVLTAYTDLIGILGGGIVAYTQLDVGWTSYFENVKFLLTNREILTGFFKAWVFAVLIAGISCYQGLSASNGAVGVGLATRRSVVICFLTVLITGYIITRIFY